MQNTEFKIFKFRIFKSEDKQMGCHSFRVNVLLHSEVSRRISRLDRAATWKKLVQQFYIGGHMTWMCASHGGKLLGLSFLPGAEGQFNVCASCWLRSNSLASEVQRKRQRSRMKARSYKSNATEKKSFHCITHHKYHDGRLTFRGSVRVQGSFCGPGPPCCGSRWLLEW